MIFRNGFFLLVLHCVVTTLFSAEPGNTVTIPKDGVFGGRSVQSGVYTLEIDDTAEQPYLRLIKNKKIVATDLALILPARGPGKTSVQVTKVAGKELIRIRARHGDKWYFAYLFVSANSFPTKD